MNCIEWKYQPNWGYETYALFKIQSEIGIASGVRRIEASTGLNLIEIMEQQENILEKLASELKTGTQDIPEKLNQLLSQIKENEKLINTLKSKIASNEGNEIVNNAIKIKNYSYIAELIDNLCAAHHDIPKADNAITLPACADQRRNPVLFGKEKLAKGSIIPAKHPNSSLKKIPYSSVDVPKGIGQGVCRIP